MSLSTLVSTNINPANMPARGTAPNSGPYQQQAPQGFPSQQQQQPNIPGTRQAVAPSASNYNSDFDNFEDNADDVDAQLAQFKKKEENGPDGNKPKPADQFVLPDADKFDPIAQSLASKVQLNPEVAQKALSGDVNSLNELLGSFAQQLIKYTVHGSLATNTEMSKLQRQQQSQEIEQGITTKQRMSDVSNSLFSAAPELRNRVSGSVLNAAMQELMAEYPTAPANLLASKLGAMFGVKVGNQKQQQQQQQPQNWLKDLAM